MVFSALRDVELRHLHALVAVAEEGSFGRAATRLGFTQSAVSQQVAALERAIGGPVFDRPGGPRRVELTPEGEVLLEGALAVLERLELAADELGRLRAGEAGRLTVGTFQSVSVRLLPDILGRLRSERPKVEVRLVEADDVDELSRGVLEGSLDASFVVCGTGIDRLELIPVCEDPFVLITPAGAETGPVAVTRLRDVPLVGQPSSSCQLLIDRGLQAGGVDPSYVFRSQDNGAVQAMVRAGMGYAVLPGLAVDSNDPGISILDLDPSIPPRRIALALRAGRTRSPALERFVELAQEVCAALQA
jgi:DNA-binding transcriptional LysR family regulator